MHLVKFGGYLMVVLFLFVMCIYNYIKYCKSWTFHMITPIFSFLFSVTCSSKTDLKILKECIEQATDSPLCFDNEHNAPKANQNPKRICPRDGER